MSPDEQQALRARVVTLKARLKEAGSHALEPNRRDAITNSDEDEQPLNEMLQVIASNRNRNAAQVIQAIDATLARWEEDPELIGLCAECEEPIAEQRLALMPYAEYCVRCQSEREGARDGRRRSITDYS